MNSYIHPLLGYVVDLVYSGPVAIPDGAEQVPLRPSPHHHLIDGQWVLNLAQWRASAVLSLWDRIKAERDRRTDQGGFPVQINGSTKWFHSDAKSRTQQIALVMMGQSMPPGIKWKTMDGSFVTMTAQIAQSIFQSGAAQDQATFSTAEQHRVAMEASSEPWSYDFSGGWPEIYAG